MSNLAKKCFLVLTAITLCAFQFNVEASTTHPQKYKLIDLGTLQSDESAACAINDNNQVVGTYKLQGKNYVFLWDEKSLLLLYDSLLMLCQKFLTTLDKLLENIVLTAFLMD